MTSPCRKRPHQGVQDGAAFMVPTRWFDRTGPPRQQKVEGTELVIAINHGRTAA